MSEVSALSDPNNALDEVEYKFVSGKRKNRLVLYVPSENQVYHRNTLSKIGRAYMCQEANCFARVYMKNDRCFKFYNSVHSHHRKVGDVCHRTAVFAEMKSMVVTNSEMSIRAIYNEVMSKNPKIRITFDEVKRTLYNIRLNDKRSACSNDELIGDRDQGRSSDRNTGGHSVFIDNVEKISRRSHVKGAQSILPPKNNMLSILLLKARDSEAELVDNIHDIVTHILMKGLTLEEKTLVTNFYNRLCKLGPALFKVLENDPLEAKLVEVVMETEPDPLPQPPYTIPYVPGKDPLKTKSEPIDVLYTDDEPKPHVIKKRVSGKAGPLTTKSEPIDVLDTNDEPQPHVVHKRVSDEGSSKQNDPDVNIKSLDEDSCDSVSSSLMDRIVSVRKDSKEAFEVNNEPMPYEFTPGARTDSNLLYSISEKQLYRRQNRSDKHDRYTCKVPHCHAVLNMRDGVLRMPKTFREHNHFNQEETYLKNKFENRMKTDLRNEADNTAIAKLFYEHLQSDPVGGANTQLKKIERNLSRIRRKNKKLKLDQSGGTTEKKEKQ